MNLGDAVLHFKGDAKDLEQKSSRIADIVKGNLISSAIQTGINKVVSGIGRITSSIGNLAVQGGFDRALNIENAEHKLQGLGHSTEEVQSIMDNALASVKGTSYGMDEAATVAASAVAAGVKPGQDLERTLKLCGDAAAISGRSMTEMGAIFNKVAAGGKMTGEELNQLTDSGIPMLQLLGDTLGKSTEEVRDLVSSGKIGFDEFRNAIEQGMGGAALNMGQTFEGALANTKAAMSRLGKTFMDPFLKGMTPVLNTTIEIIDMIAEGSTDELEAKTKELGDQLKTMIDNVLKSLKPILENAIPIITSVIETLIGLLPDLINQLFPTILNAIFQLITSLVGQLPTIIQALINAFVTIVQALAQQAPVLIPQIITAIMDGLMTILDNIDLLIDAGIQLIFGIQEGFIDKGLPILIDKMPEIIDKIVTALVNNTPKLIVCAIQLAVALANGLVKSIPKIVSKIPQIVNSIVNGFMNLATNIYNVGASFLTGLWNGFISKGSWMLNKVKEFAGNILNSIKKKLGIASPSKEFFILGQYSVMGYTEALDSMQKEVQSSINSVFDLQPNISGQMSSAYSPTMVVNVTNNLETDPLGQLVNKVKTFSGGAKNDYNWGAGL